MNAVVVVVVDDVDVDVDDHCLVEWMVRNATDRAEENNYHSGVVHRVVKAVVPCTTDDDEDEEDGDSALHLALAWS